MYLELGRIKGSTQIICSPLQISDCIWRWPLGRLKHVKAEDWNERPIYLYHVPPYPRPYMDAWKVQRSVAHRWPGVGRMLGCRILLHFHPFGQRILIFGCMTARRCARCSLGVFQLLWPACEEGRPDLVQAVQCNVHFSQRTPWHCICQSWIWSWRFLKPALSVLCFSGRCFIFTGLQSACWGSVGYLESALHQYLVVLL